MPPRPHRPASSPRPEPEALAPGERRAGRRLPVALAVSVAGPDGHRRFAQALDLSRGGAFLRLSSPLVAGEPVLLEVPGFARGPLTVTARVARRTGGGVGLALAGAALAPQLASFFDALGG